MDIRMTFDGVADVYDRVRPSYPPALFDTLFECIPADPQILEIGPGTGQATVELLARGAIVTAVELGPTLAARLREKFAGNENLTVVNDSFEGADLEHHSFDAITVATAYHWVETGDQLTRPVELLRPGGALGVIDLIQVDSDVDRGYFDRVTSIYERYGAGKDDGPPKTYMSAESPMLSRLRASELYSNVEILRVRWDQTYTSAGYRDLLSTYSGTQMMPEPSRTQMVNELVAVIDAEFQGQITRPLVATLTLATVG